MPKVYDPDFFARRSDAARRSAEVVIDLVADLVRPQSVLDVGCGTGSWLSVWRDRGVADVLGIDGDYIPPERLEVPRELFRAHDLASPLRLGRRFDLVESLEVAEHLPPARAMSFVADVVAHGDVVLFSAAIPGQRGRNHVNCRWQSYWAAMFAEHGYAAVDAVRPVVWDDDRVEPWYRQNLLLYVSAARRAAMPATSRPALPLDVAHPWMLRAPTTRQLLRALPATLTADIRRKLARRESAER